MYTIFAAAVINIRGLVNLEIYLRCWPSLLYTAYKLTLNKCLSYFLFSKPILYTHHHFLWRVSDVNMSYYNTTKTVLMYKCAIGLDVTSRRDRLLRNTLNYGLADGLRVCGIQKLKMNFYLQVTWNVYSFLIVYVYTTRALNKQKCNRPFYTRMFVVRSLTTRMPEIRRFHNWHVPTYILCVYIGMGERIKSK